MAYSERNIRTDRGPPSSKSREQENQHERPKRYQNWEEQHGGRDNSRDQLHRSRESHRSDSEDKRARKPQPSNGRPPSQGPPRSQQSRPPAVHSEPHLRSPVSASQSYGVPSRNMPLKKLSFSEKCSNLCSRRGILQFVEILVNILVLICVVASFAVTSGFTSSGGVGMGSLTMDAMISPFEGTEFQQARELDMQYSQLRAPGVYGGVSFSLAIGAVTLGFLILGARPFHHLSIRILLAELVFEVLACVGYIVAVALYLHFITVVNATDLCKKRAQLYAGRGYNWMNCEVQGGDAAVAIFGLVAACLYLPSAVLCGLTIKSVREYRRNLPPEDYIASSFKERDYNMYKIQEDAAEITLV
ncbi:MARVEL domain-containing protein 3-like isoform X2 [Pleurodeles waltl]|uniref:MARVEL domain-containing protein 3-like isoform X2 n=1 Tax=Pleurodeles waltl TaxID=8319 RepID=UPI00370941EC